jgi:hypothetical protein
MALPKKKATKGKPNQNPQKIRMKSPQQNTAANSKCISERLTTALDTDRIFIMDFLFQILRYQN